MKRNLINTTYRTLCFNDIKNKVPNIEKNPNTDPQIKKDAELAELNSDLNRLGNDFRLDVDQQHESEQKKEEIEHEHQKESKQNK
jgi:hypothetical protein